MKNKDNKTTKVADFDLTKYTKLIDGNPLHIATINKNNKPNLAVASDVKVLEKDKILISNNEMIHTPDNILQNKNVVLTSFNDKWAGLRMTGTAEYFTSGKYFDLDNELFLNETATPKGAIVVKVKTVESLS